MADDVLRLLIIEKSLEDAEYLLSTLRNAGIAARPSSAENIEEVQAALERKLLDIVLINADHPDLSVEAVADAVTRSGKDLPVIAVADEYSPEKLLSLQGRGAVDAAAGDNTDHLVGVVRREVANLANRRRLRFIETSLREAEKRCHSLLDSSRDAIAYVHEGMHVYANPAYLQLFSYDDFEELEGLPILDMVSSKDSEQLKKVLKSLSKGEPPPDQIEVKLKMPTGGTKDSLMEFSPASIDGEPCTQVVLRDRSVDAEMAKELRDLRTQDLVTGLYNRQHLLRAVEDAIARIVQGAEAHSVLFIDIDNFKESSEQVGLAGVDLVLSDLAGLIRDALGEGELAARFGDHTFAILCVRDLSGAEALGRKLCQAVEAHISEVGGTSITLTASIGVTSVLESVSNAQDILGMASSAARQAQSDGGNQVHVHDPVRQKPGEDDSDLRWVALVRDALDNDRLALVFQPIVSLHGEERQTYEVMFRLKTKDGEEISPKEFMPVIAEHELAGQVDRWVIEHAMVKLREQIEASGRPVTFFIKVLAETLADPTVLPWLAKQMQANRLSGDSLVFEMPESKLMTNLKPAKQFLKGLRQLHCKFAIEQFGGGLNSFQILKHVPADYLKIDRTFMHDLPKNEEHQAKVRELAQQAQSVGKITVAEFVEDAASMSILWQCGVNFVQGNFLQEPLREMTYEFI